MVLVAVGVFADYLFHAGSGVPPHARGAESDGPSQSLTPGQIFARTTPAVVKVTAFDAAAQQFKFGSGFFVSADGLLVTNFHVINEATFATARADGGTELTVEGVVAFDPQADLAILRVRGNVLPFLRLAQTSPQVGERAFAIGNPEGLTDTLSEGLISGLRDRNGLQEIQTNAAISHGSSGGPLLSEDGTVVGVTSSSLVGGQSLNFAVPAHRVAQLLKTRGRLVSLASTWTNPDDPTENVAFAEAWVALNKGDPLGAANRLTEMLHRQAANPYYWWTMGCVDMKLRTYGGAEYFFRRAIQLQTDYAPAHLCLGDALESQEEHTAALEEYRSAARLNPQSAGAFLGAAIAYAGLGDSANSLRLAKTAARLDPSNVWSHRFLGRVYFNGGEYGAAVDECNRAVQLVDDDIETELRLGDAHDRIREYREAWSAYTRAVTLDPRNAYGYLWIGWECLRLGDGPSAAAAWTRAAQLDPAGRIGAFARENLRSQFDSP